MNEKIPERLEKFQKALEEKQVVTDAKMKKMIKDGQDKVSKTVKATAESVTKIKQGFMSFQ